MKKNKNDKTYSSDFYSRYVSEEFLEGISEKQNEHTGSLTVLFFTSETCGNCKYVEEIMNEIEKNGVSVFYINTSSPDMKYIRMKYSVTVTPTVVVIKDGEVIDKIDGSHHRQRYNKIIRYFSD